MNLFLLLVACTTPAAECDGPISVVGVADSDELAAFCAAACQVDVSGDVYLWMDGADLSCLASVEGDVTLLDRDGGRYAGPAGLRRIGGDLVLAGQRRVTALGGFSSLAEIGGDLRLDRAAGLTTIDGFGALETVGGDLRLTALPALATASRIGLDTVGGEVELSDLSLTDATLLEGLGATSRVTVTDLPWLTSLDGLSALDWSGTGIHLAQLPELRDLSALSSATGLGDVFLHAIGVSDLSPLSGVTSIGSLLVDGLPLASLSGLDALETVGRDLEFIDNAYLSDIGALSTSLRSVGGDLQLSGSPDVPCDDLEALVAAVEIGGWVGWGHCEGDIDTGIDTDDTDVDPDDTGIDPFDTGADPG